MVEEERPNKRLRTADDPSSDSDIDIEGSDPETVEDETVWMHDGNVVIAAGSSPVHVFKCHKSVLSKHSEVFRDMFGSPVAENAEGLQSPMYTSLPKVDLSDSPDDVRAFLAVLYDVT